MQDIVGMRTVTVRIGSYGEVMHPEPFAHTLKDLMSQPVDARVRRTPGSSRLRRPLPFRRR
jgi:hypothetical protein